jgi:hypothetical protein
MLMTHADGEPGNSATLGERDGSIVQHDLAPPFRRTSYLNRAPLKVVCFQRPKDLHDSFLRRKPSREPLVRTAWFAPAVADLSISENEAREPLSKPGNGIGDVLDSNEVDPDKKGGCVHSNQTRANGKQM